MGVRARLSDGETSAATQTRQGAATRPEPGRATSHQRRPGRRTDRTSLLLARTGRPSAWHQPRDPRPARHPDDRNGQDRVGRPTDPVDRVRPLPRRTHRGAAYAATATILLGPQVDASARRRCAHPSGARTGAHPRRDSRPTQLRRHPHRPRRTPMVALCRASRSRPLCTFAATGDVALFDACPATRYSRGRG